MLENPKSHSESIPSAKSWRGITEDQHPEDTTTKPSEHVWCFKSFSTKQKNNHLWLMFIGEKRIVRFLAATDTDVLN